MTALNDDNEGDTASIPVVTTADAIGVMATMESCAAGVKAATPGQVEKINRRL